MSRRVLILLIKRSQIIQTPNLFGRSHQQFCQTRIDLPPLGRKRPDVQPPKRHRLPVPFPFRVVSPKITIFSRCASTCLCLPCLLVVARLDTRLANPVARQYRSFLAHRSKHVHISM
ncbi:hypothetical protein BC629DRAFT_372539 [Irpex lacteus]|nr:hypothetical protein BC629DRAFT_372539 [Irpex lacteus]